MTMTHTETEFLATTCPPSGARCRTIYLAAARLTSVAEGGRRKAEGSEGSLPSAFRVEPSDVRWWVGRVVWLTPVGRHDWLQYAEYPSEARALADYRRLLVENEHAVPYDPE